MARVFSGIQPTGDLHLGNYLGAVVNWVRDLDRDESIFCIVDLHAITIPQDPAELKARSRNLAALLMACGLDPERCILFVQSHVPQHAQLAWLMQSVVSYGELGRMTQFKDKSDQHKFVSAGLFTYPALQAADILLYDTEKVPVGADQKQHIELCRDAAERFNGRYGTEEQPIFVMPVHSTPAAGARVMDLQHPDKKMSKSLDSPQGTVLVLDDPKAIEKKFKRLLVAPLHLRKGLLKRILGQLDHQVLNDVPGLEKPTFENILLWIESRMKAEGVSPSRLEIERPTLKQRAVYTPQ